MATPRVLVLNAGSSSLKASLVELPSTTIGTAEASWGADASRSGDRGAGVEQVLSELGITHRPEGDAASHGVSGQGTSASGVAASGVAAQGVDTVGYRVVHGGSRFIESALIDQSVIDGIREVQDLAPLHNGVALETIAAGRSLLPLVPHVACFDTAFHATLAPEAYRYPVPEHWYRDWGIRRYGFHGLSVAWSSARAAEMLGRDVASLGIVVAHLGSGCSVTTVARGQSVETSMGLTPLEGLMMGTRSGSIDPGVPFHLMSSGLLDADQIIDALDHASGLLGVSGSSSDMRELAAAADSGNERASLAISMFVRRAAAAIAAAATALPRLDALVFTGGIGEHAPAVRGAIIERLGVVGAGAMVDDTSDRGGDAELSLPGAPVAILRITAREDLVIAREAGGLLA